MPLLSAPVRRCAAVALLALATVVTLGCQGGGVSARSSADGSMSTMNMNFPSHEANAMSHKMPSKETLDCMKACGECAAMCAPCSHHCLHLGGEHASPEHQGIMRDCAEICGVAACFMARNSHHSAHLCRECAEICRECAASCEKIAGGDAMMKGCAEMCRRCAASCEKIASVDR